MLLEGMFGEHDKQARAETSHHMMMQEAATLAAKTNSRQLWLTHYSPSMTHPEEFMKEVKKIFPQAVAARDGRTLELNFEDEEEKQ